MISLILSVLVLFTGPLFYHFFGRYPLFHKILDTLSIALVGAWVVFHTLPHCFDSLGMQALFVFLAGLLGPTIVESWIDAQELTAHKTIKLFILIGLSLHALGDGVGLALAGHSEHEHHAHTAQAALILHHIPISMVLWRLASAQPVLAALSWFTLSASEIAGFYFGTSLFAHLNEASMAYVEAFVGGTLVHIIVHKSHKKADGHCPHCE